MNRRATPSGPTPPRPFAALFALLSLALACGLPSLHALSLTAPHDCSTATATSCRGHAHRASEDHDAHRSPADHPASPREPDHDPASCPVCQIILATSASLPSLALDASPVWDAVPALDIAPGESQTRQTFAVIGHLPARGPPPTHT